MARERLSTSGLPLHEGRNVAAAAMKILKVGGGLDERLRLDPVVLHQGDEFVAVVRGKIIDVQFPAEKRKEPDGSVVRTHVGDAFDVVLVDPTEYEHVFEVESDRLRAIRVERGEEDVPLDFADGEDPLAGDGPAESVEDLANRDLAADAEEPGE